MKPAVFKQVLAAARDIVRHADTGATLDPLTVEWARSLLASNPERARLLGPSQAKVLAVFETDPMAGLSVADIRTATGMVGPALLTTMTGLKNAKLLFQLFQWGRSRYFLSEEAMEAGRPAFEADEQAFRESRTTAPVKIRPQLETYDRPPTPPPLRQAPRPAQIVVPAPAKPAKPPKPPKPEKPPKPPKKPHLGRGGGGAFNPDTPVKIPRPTVLHSGKAFIPDHVKVQVIPAGVDTRFTVDPKEIKGGFADEWQRARQVGHLRGEKS